MVDEKHPEGSRENEALKLLIKKYPEVFSTEKDPITVILYYMSTITQLDNESVYRKPYPIPVCYHSAIRKQLQTLQEEGIIRSSQSAYNSPLIPVPKKDGGIRLCLDFRALNTKIKDDRFPFPNIQAILQQMGTCKIFSCLDLRAGYYQIPLDEASKEKTAFTSPEGH